MPDKSISRKNVFLSFVVVVAHVVAVQGRLLAV